MHYKNITVIKILGVVTVIFFLSACTGWMKVNCGWMENHYPLTISRDDTLTRGTQNQIVAINQAYEANCKEK